MTIDEQIEIMQWFRDGGEVEVTDTNGEWRTTRTPMWKFHSNKYRKKEYIYSMWFKAKDTEAILEFSALSQAEVVRCRDCNNGFEVDGDVIECSISRALFGYDGIVFKPDWFCPKGKKDIK